MFAHGASEKDKVEMFMYGAEEEDFGKGDASVLDEWVFDRFDTFLRNASTHDKALGEAYLNNIKVVDEGIARVVKRLDEFYENDGKTAYVFTADHGMSNRGGHGDGHPDNTQTPLISWGAGIVGPGKSRPDDHDQLSVDWDMTAFQRVDVNQADIAPLMSVLVGVPYPLNSVGELPLRYLSGTEKFKAEAAFGNAKQVLAQYLVKESIKRRTELFFKPFGPLASRQRGRAMVEKIQGLIDDEKYEEAINLGKELIRLCIEGLRYYQTTLFLVIKYAGGATPNPSSSSAAQKSARDLARSERRTINIVTAIISLSILALLIRKESPLLYYVYTAFPIFFWSESMKRRSFVVERVAGFMKKTGGGGGEGRSALIRFTGSVVLYVVVLEVLPYRARILRGRVKTFIIRCLPVYSYFSREILTPCLFLAGLVWPFTMPKPFRSRHGPLLISWAVFSCLTGVFTLLPVEKGQDVVLVTIGGGLVLVSGTVALFILPRYVSSGLPLTTSASGSSSSSSSSSSARATATQESAQRKEKDTPLLMVLQGRKRPS
ncbi:Glycosyl phosphatidyl inositol anchor synthesis [Quaeritorhiza haematococci]|nr:Glycosyl phosphatidyl inositol anchor synthesis [Quaeritorhiza haematococci]